MRLIATITASLILGLALTIGAHAGFELKLNKGVAAYVKKDYEGALALFEEALQLSPESPEVNRMVGLCLDKLGRYGESLRYLEKAEKLDPDMERIHMDLGSAYLKVNKPRKALEQFKLAVARDEKNAVAQYNLAYAQFLLGRYDDALNSFDTASNLDPAVALPSLFYSGVSNYRLERYREASSLMKEIRAKGKGTAFATAADQYLKSIAAATKPYYGSFSSGFQYDSNVTLEPDGIDITDEDDVRGVIYFNLGINRNLTDSLAIDANWRAFFSFHANIENLNVQSHRLTLTGTKKAAIKSKPVFYSLTYFYDVVLVNDSPANNLFSQTHSVSPKLTLKWSESTSTEFYPEVRFDNFKDFPERDAYNINFTIAEPVVLYAGRFRVRPGVNTALNLADDLPGRRNFDEFATNVFVETLTILPHGLSFYAEGHYSAGDFYNDDFNRFDNTLGVRVVASKILYKTTSLDVGYENVSNFSKSDFPGKEPFQYFRNIVSVTLSARF